MTDIATELPRWLNRLEYEVTIHLDGESSGHDPCHAFRVKHLATGIGTAVGADLDVVQAAALLHDIGHADGRVGHADRGANLAANLLSSCGFPGDKIPQVVACIQKHHWLPGRSGDPTDPSLEYQAFADADRLDALGAVGIARVFAFGGAHQRPVWNPDPNASVVGPYGISSIHHFYDKLLRLPGDMYTAAGRRLASKRVTFMKQFLETFYQEWEQKDIEAPLVASDKTSLSSLPKRSINISNRIRRIFAAIFQPDPIG